jgi:hypothetical protein
MPTSAHGKLDQRSLEGIVLGYLANSTVKTDKTVVSKVPHSDTESAVISILGQVLSRNPDSIDLDASFVDLGGTSIHAMRFATVLQNYGMSLSIGDILNNLMSITALVKQAQSGGENLNGGSKLDYKPFCLASDSWESDLAAVSDLKPHDVEDVYPCNDLTNYWLKLTKESHGCAMLCQFHHTLGPNVNPGHFSWCWEQIRMREATLRTVFVEANSNAQDTEVSRFM